ncbi:hypothetical protein TPHA_0L01160 [Tetrapisispora phaffii CBS 4417]|uniref:Porphobilinogen deaminase n=1 Tax=Tetrapisispora phaffii (strain ATCC 24235 / CBS 4417 / NBRC 1672 / NRRL Y-8282 / UCD 70-5) TaxID=1071381 RepID=G8BZZ5_TETPH|nr:hypothetical protein TPHA_0L01160 [Tetrapisispora phaffii CBS 4417]CCE65473.1 hypothetical protein TPHA_0L01160 [Tetrapisispora phaffii CBS 4417]
MANVQKKETLVIGGRKSKLAVAQSYLVKELIETEFPHYECEVVKLSTLGDQFQSQPLYSFGGKAVWTKELEDLLYHEEAEKRIDMIVHSLKDVPTLLPEGFELGCITKRVNPYDCLVMPLNSKYKTLEELPAGSVVGTSSIRRSAQLKRKYPYLKFESARGNIHTRLAKVDDENSHFSCIIIAAAGLMRTGLEHRITKLFDRSTMYYAVGQGALGVEIRSDDEKIKSILKKIEDKESTIRCLAERSLLRTLEGGCSVPVGVETSYDDATQHLLIKGIVVDVEGTKAIEEEITMTINDIKSDSMEAGKLLASKMIKSGAKEILDSIVLDKIN